MPPNHVNRPILLEEIATKLLQATNDPRRYETTLNITGVGGFGKTTITESLCYHPHVTKEFTDGFIFIKLGPQPPAPNVKLRAIYNLLTDKQCDINVAEQKINQLISDYYRNLLIIIDDVWHVEDAEPLVRAFSNCKTILTTRMNDIEQSIPSVHSVTIGPMTEDEAISLLTSGVIDNRQLSQEDVSLLNEISQDAHQWPLLLSLIRGQLSHFLKQYHLRYHKAIQDVQARLHHKGLTAFNRNLAVKACIEVTLGLLSKSLSNNIKTLIMWTGIGTSLQIALLSKLWKLPEFDAQDTVDTLWGYGLVQFTDITISFSNVKQCSVEVHAVISQYIIESIDSNEVCILSADGELGTSLSVHEGLDLLYHQSCGVQDLSLLTPVDYLKYKQSQIEDSALPYFLKLINMYTVTDPHIVMLQLQKIKSALTTSNEEINSLIINCKKILYIAHNLCRKFNQSVQIILYEKNYNRLTQTVEEFIKNYHLCNVAQEAVTVAKKIIPYCNGNLVYYIKEKCGFLQMKTASYLTMTTLTLPHIKLFIELHEKITNSLLNGSPDIELTYHYIVSGKFDEEFDLVGDNRLIKLQEIVPDYVYKLYKQNYDTYS